MKYLILILFLFGCSSEDVTTYVPIEHNYIDNNKRFLDIINNYRIENNLPELKGERTLYRLAVIHTDYMIEQNKASHDYFYQRYIDSKSKHFGECVGKHYDTERLFNMYLKSEGHKKVIDNPRFTHIGIEYRNRFNTLIFARYD